MLRERTRGPVLFVAAHPDDETVGASAEISLRTAEAVFVHVTDGAPRNMLDARAYGFATHEAYRAARRRELEAALGIAGIEPDRLRSLGCADQEASLHMPALCGRLRAILTEIRPAAVWTHPYEGGHPDHDATALIVHAAVHGLETPPVLVEFTSYHANGNGVAVFEFLANGECPETVRVLSEEGRERKRLMLDCFATQRNTLAMFPAAIERFRPAPRYDFRRAPHDGMLHYDRYDWGMRGERWRELARGALAEVGLEGAI